MSDHLTPSRMTEADARLALREIDDRRRDVVAEIAAPRWYWPALAAGWVAVGVITDVASPWVAAIATLVFGASHAAVAHRAVSGRHGSDLVSVRSEVIGRRSPALVLACLVVLTIVTVGIALVIHADGARHPVTIACSACAVAILLGGPQLMGMIRTRAERDLVG